MSKFPPSQFRLKAEDLIRDITASDSQMVKAEIIDAAYTLLDDYQQNVQIRN
jgi:hypothetical protein